MVWSMLWEIGRLGDWEMGMRTGTASDEGIWEGLLEEVFKDGP